MILKRGVDRGERAGGKTGECCLRYITIFNRYSLLFGRLCFGENNVLFVKIAVECYLENRNGIVEKISILFLCIQRTVR